MKRSFLRIAGIVLLVLCAVDAVDWLFWQLRVTRGSGMDSITVSQVTAEQLKGNREEYSLDGDISIACARSLLPPLTSQGWLPTCWYLRRHTVIVTRI